MGTPTAKPVIGLSSLVQGTYTTFNPATSASARAASGRTRASWWNAELIYDDKKPRTLHMNLYSSNVQEAELVFMDCNALSDNALGTLSIIMPQHHHGFQTITTAEKDVNGHFPSDRLTFFKAGTYKVDGSHKHGDEAFMFALMIDGAKFTFVPSQKGDKPGSPAGSSVCSLLTSDQHSVCTASPLRLTDLLSPTQKRLDFGKDPAHSPGVPPGAGGSKPAPGFTPPSSPKSGSGSTTGGGTNPPTPNKASGENVLLVVLLLGGVLLLSQCMPCK